ncbi:sugar transferase [Jejudonia soesokkakensis]|uniref:Sugar transferase n=1 Tax=Jejudonia soesokkakensis TaxID=1323432 RepID=A0ABW2MT23_9FLAO
MLTKQQHIQKRIFDVLLALVLLPFLILPIIILWVLASISTKQNGLFFQKRIGRYGTPFFVYKLRSLQGKNHQSINEMKALETSFGRWLRRTKLDELPQLFNVLSGTMSWVGPRPDVPGYADLLEGTDRNLLQVRPGVTGPATLKYKNEDVLLLQQKDPNLYNDTVIWPDKVQINKRYVETWSFSGDLKYLWRSVFGA